MPVKECKNCKSCKNGVCSKKNIKVSINATWCVDYDINTIVGKLITADLEDNTMLLKIEGETTFTSGIYAIVPIEEYEKLIK